MTFVGALNVGSMSLHFDPELITNSPKTIKEPYYFDKNFLKEDDFTLFQKQI